MNRINQIMFLFLISFNLISCNPYTNTKTKVTCSNGAVYMGCYILSGHKIGQATIECPGRSIIPSSNLTCEEGYESWVYNVKDTTKR